MTLTRRAKAQLRRWAHRQDQNRQHALYCRNRREEASALEALVCEHLCRWGLRHRHEPHSFPVTLEGGGRITYTPDIEVEGVLIEPHGSLDDVRFLAKMSAFKRSYPGRVVVLVSSSYELQRAPEGLFDAVVASQEITNLRPVLRRLLGSGSLRSAPSTPTPP